jgi:uncharacterized protein YfkK (UPF0435 family)
MDSARSERPVLNDLALIYIALAHATDQQLSDAEMGAIAERLRAWQDESTETVLGALKQALDDYVADESGERIVRAVGQVGERVPADIRQRILDDLLGIAMADDRFLFSESSFISDIERAWGVHASARDNAAGGWSVLRSDGDSTSWTPLHDLALVYITLAHRADEMRAEEMDAIAKKLNEWLPDASESEVLEIVRTVLEVYAQGADERVFVDAVESIRKCLPSHQLEAVFADLQFIAEADGSVQEAERELISRLRQKLSA